MGEDIKKHLTLRETLMQMDYMREAQDLSIHSIKRSELVKN